MDKIRYQIAVIPATIFWWASMQFFIMGLSVDDTTGKMYYVAIGLAIANTIIQIIGNGIPKEELGPVIVVGWIASYVLGFASNFYALSLIMNIPIQWVEFAVCASLGAMIEGLPERFWVLAWRATFPNGMSFSRKPKPRPYSEIRHDAVSNDNSQSQKFDDTRPHRPKGMSREEWRKQLAQQYHQIQPTKNDGERVN